MLPVKAGEERSNKDTMRLVFLQNVSQSDLFSTKSSYVSTNMSLHYTIQVVLRSHHFHSTISHTQ